MYMHFGDFYCNISINFIKPFLDYKAFIYIVAVLVLGSEIMRKKKERGKNGAIKKSGEKLICAMQIPMASVLDLTHFELNGNREVVVDGCKGILEYDENIVRLSTGKMITKFLGRHLNIKCLTPDSLVIEGVITNIEFIT